MDSGYKYVFDVVIRAGMDLYESILSGMIKDDLV